LENKLEEAFGFKAKRTYIDNGEHGTKRETGTGTRHKDAEQKKPSESGVLSGAGLPARGIRVHFASSNEDWLCKIGGSKRCMEATINLLHPQTPCLRKTPERLLEIIICHISAYSELELHRQFDLAFNGETEITAMERFELHVGILLAKEIPAPVRNSIAS